MSPHAVLGLPTDADADAIRRRYRELAKVCHPDAGGDPADFIRLQYAYRALLDGNVDRVWSAAAAEPDSWKESAPEFTATADAESRPQWWDDIVDRTERRGEQKEERRRNLYVEQALPDRSVAWLALATFGAACMVMVASCLKGGAPDVASCIGQTIVYGTFLFIASAASAAVGAGQDDRSFDSTYLGVLSLLAGALTVAVPLPFLRPG